MTPDDNALRARCTELAHQHVKYDNPSGLPGLLADLLVREINAARAEGRAVLTELFSLECCDSEACVDNHARKTVEYVSDLQAQLKAATEELERSRYATRRAVERAEMAERQAMNFSAQATQEHEFVEALEQDLAQAVERAERAERELAIAQEQFHGDTGPVSGLLLATQADLAQARASLATLQKEHDELLAAWQDDTGREWVSAVALQAQLKAATERAEKAELELKIADDEDGIVERALDTCMTERDEVVRKNARIVDEWNRMNVAQVALEQDLAQTRAQLATLREAAEPVSNRAEDLCGCIEYVAFTGSWSRDTSAEDIYDLSKQLKDVLDVFRERVVALAQAPAPAKPAEPEGT